MLQISLSLVLITIGLFCVNKKYKNSPRNRGIFLHFVLSCCSCSSINKHYLLTYLLTQASAFLVSCTASLSVFLNVIDDDDDDDADDDNDT